MIPIVAQMGDVAHGPLEPKNIGRLVYVIFYLFSGEVGS